MENSIIQGLEMVMKSLEGMKPKDIDEETQSKVDDAILKGHSQIEELKSQLQKVKKDIKL